MFLQRMHLGLNEGGLFSHEMRQMKGKGGFWRNNKLQHKGECGQNACRYYHPSYDRGCFSMQILASPFKHIRFNITLPYYPDHFTKPYCYSMNVCWPDLTRGETLSNRKTSLSKFVHVMSYNSCSLLKVNIVSRHCVICRRDPTF